MANSTTLHFKPKNTNFSSPEDERLFSSSITVYYDSNNSNGLNTSQIKNNNIRLYLDSDLNNPIEAGYYSDNKFPHNDSNISYIYEDKDNNDSNTNITEKTLKEYSTNNSSSPYELQPSKLVYSECYFIPADFKNNSGYANIPRQYKRIYILSKNASSHGAQINFQKIVEDKIKGLSDNKFPQTIHVTDPNEYIPSSIDDFHDDNFTSIEDVGQGFGLYSTNNNPTDPKPDRFIGFKSENSGSNQWFGYDPSSDSFINLTTSFKANDIVSSGTAPAEIKADISIPTHNTQFQMVPFDNPYNSVSVSKSNEQIKINNRSEAEGILCYYHGMNNILKTVYYIPQDNDGNINSNISVSELSLKDLAQRNIWLFTNKDDLIKYQLTNNPYFYSSVYNKHAIKEKDNYNYWIFNSVNNIEENSILWEGLNSNNEYALSCIFTGLKTRSINLYYLEDDENKPLNYFTKCPIEGTFYYNSYYNLTFKEIVNNNLIIYNNEFEAQQNSSNYASNGPYGEDLNSFYYFYKNNNTHTWKGLGSLGNKIIDSINDKIDQPFTNTITNRDNKNIDEILTISNSINLQTYYAFWECKPTQNSKDLLDLSTENHEYRLYIVPSNIIKNNNILDDFVDYMNNQNPKLTTFKGENSCKCYTYKHTIYANNFEDIVYYLTNSTNPNERYDRVVPINYLSELGIESYSNIHLFEDCNKCDQNSTPDDKYKININIESIKKQPNTNLESNWKLDNLSKPLLRTNPKLSTNIKLVANKNDQIFAESINASQQLSNSKYKRYELDPNGSWQYDLSNFWNKTETPYQTVFEVKRDRNDYSVLTNYADQLETTYHYGAHYNNSKLYNEQFRIMAPIWLDLNIPKKFIIYKIKEPKSNILSNNRDKINNIIKNSSIVQSFDLSKESSLGKYLNNYINNENFPKAPLTFSFEKNNKSSFNGISLEKGGFTSKEEYLYRDFVEQDNPIIEENSLLTNGFERNYIACPNLINLEFLFDDDYSNVYEVNRYFGIFVDEFQTGSGNIDTIKDGIIEFNNLNSYFNQGDETFAIPPKKLFFNNPALGYIKLKNNYYAIDNNSNYNERNRELSIKASDSEIRNNLGIVSKNRLIDIKSDKNANSDFITMEFIDKPEENDRIKLVKNKRQAYELKIAKYISNSTVKLEDNNGNILESGSQSTTINELFNDLIDEANNNSFSNFYEISIKENDNNSLYIREKKPLLSNRGLEITDNQGIMKLDKVYLGNDTYEGFFMYTSNLPKGTFQGSKISNQGDLSDIAIATSAAIKNENYFDSKVLNNIVYAISTTTGYNLNQRSLLIYKNNTKDFINKDKLINPTIEFDELVKNQWDIYKAIGGCRLNHSILVNESYINGNETGGYLLMNNNYNKIIDIVDNINNLNDNNKRLILENENELKNGEYELFGDSFVQIGLFSGYDVYDMNFDFYDTSNSDLKELKLETNDNIQYKPYNDSVDDGKGLNKSLIMDENFQLNPRNYFKNILPLLKDEDISPTNNPNIDSEYDRLKENYLKEYSTLSRITPHINKWVLKNAMTVRDNPYYLNANQAFGKTNFAPDIRNEGRSRLGYTHEWFYLINWPQYFNYDEYNLGFSYINFINNYKVNKHLFKSIDYNYFNMFMIGDGYETTVDLGNKQVDFFTKTNKDKKYTLIKNGNENQFGYTFFKGLKFKFKEKRNKSNQNFEGFIKNNNFNDYKFSIVANINDESNTNSLNFETIKNDKWNFIIFYINININDPYLNNSINRKLLYELRHKIQKDDTSNDNSTYVYSDVKLDGAISVPTGSFDDNNNVYQVKGISNDDGTQPKFIEQIAVNEEGRYGEIAIDTGGQNILYLNVLSVEDNTTLLLEEKPYTKDSSGQKSYIQTDYLVVSNFINASYTYLKGGINSHKILLEQLSSSNINNILSNQTTYTTIKENGDITENEYVIEVEDGKEIIKKSNLNVIIDKNRPKTYSINKQKIGYELIEEENIYYPFLIRHNGNYTVDFNPIVTFTDPFSHFKIDKRYLNYNIDEINFKENKYKHKLDSNYDVKKAKAYYEKFNRLGICFNVGFINDDGKHDQNWGIISNHFYHKVNEDNPNGVIKLSETSQFLPQYPLIGEVAIDKRNLEVFKSPWEENYYIRNLKSNGIDYVHGNLSTIEHKSYFSSTLMNVNKTYTLSDFDYLKITNETELNSIKNNQSINNDIILFEDNNQIIIDFYINNKLYKKFKELGIGQDFYKNIDPSNSIGDKNSLEDDIKSYVENNLIPLFNYKEITIYAYKSNNIETNINNIDLNFLDLNFYEELSNYTIDNHFNSNLNFRLIYNKRINFNYSLKPIIKINM